jgi:thiol-disulfide isomerase/thioredoxin
VSVATGPDRPEVTLPAGTEYGTRATLVQFSTAFCQPCRATRGVLAGVARLVPGVRHLDIDAESHLDLVRALAISSTPTVLVLDARRRLVRRATGVPSRQAVLAALAEALTPEEPDDDRNNDDPHDG